MTEIVRSLGVTDQRLTDPEQSLPVAGPAGAHRRYPQYSSWTARALRLVDLIISCVDALIMVTERGLRLARKLRAVPAARPSRSDLAVPADSKLADERPLRPGDPGWHPSSGRPAEPRPQLRLVR